jgi:hypothetical protein
MVLFKSIAEGDSSSLGRMAGIRPPVEYRQDSPGSSSPKRISRADPFWLLIA